MAFRQITRRFGVKENQDLRRIGEKVTKVIKAGQKTAAVTARKVVRRALKAIPISQLAGRAADIVRNVQERALNALPGPAREVARRVYRLTPIDNVVSRALLTLDVASGRKKLTLKELEQIFPKLAELIRTADALAGLRPRERRVVRAFIVDQAGKVAAQLAAEINK